MPEEPTDSVTLLTMEEINSVEHWGCRYHENPNSFCGRKATLVIQLSYCSLTLEERKDGPPWLHDPHPREDCKDGGVNNDDYTVVCELHAHVMRTQWPNVARIHSLAKEAS